VAILQPDPAVPGQSKQPDGNMTMYMALVDSGASSTCISSRIVKEVGLSPIGKIQVAGVHGSTPTNSYQFAVGFILPVRQEATGAIFGNMTGFVVDGTEFVNDGCGFDVLLGRDILCKGSFHMSFDGHFLICF
jgi:Aspartyl protease